jgi:uncharacterized membrane protein
MGYDSFLYKLFLFLHVLAVIIGFGGVLLNGLYASRARRYTPDQSLAVMEVNGFVSMKVAEIFIFLAAVFGFGLVGLSDDVYTFGQLWIWLSIIIYVVYLGISHGVLMPRVRALTALQRELAGGTAGPDAPGRIEALGKQIGASSGVLHLAFVVILILMIWKPGAGL